MSDHTEKTKISYAAHKKTPPCRGCKERALGCHGWCERYIQWKTENDAYREDYFKEKHSDAVITSFVIRKRRIREY